MKRREFLPGIAATIMGTMISPKAFALEEEYSHNLNLSLTDEDFWTQIRAQFRTGDKINLNNGGVSPHPLSVEEAFFNYHRICNEAPSYHMWRKIEKLRTTVREKLANIAGCLPEEIAINRNTTEAMVTITMNLSLSKGDEVVVSKFDYPRMMNAWKAREEREGIILRWVNPEEGFPDDDTIVARYISQFNDKTKVVHLTHMINWTGRVIPVKRIIDEAKKRGIITIVDAAHSFAHIPFKISDLGCDYLGASLHKWLSAPFGNGMLYVKKENIGKIHPFFPVEKDLDLDIKKFEELGTRNNASEMAISQAIDFYLSIGAERKYERLLELRNHWIDQIKNNPTFKILTPLEKERSGAIGLVEVVGKKAIDIDVLLLTKYKIHCVSIQHEGINALRITPNVYTTKSELDIFVKALLEVANQ